MNKIPEIPKGKVVSRTSAADPWYGNNITKIIETENGKFFRVCYSDCHGPDSKWTTVTEVKPVQTTRWEVVNG